jgi:hypothetical protein
MNTLWRPLVSLRMRGINFEYHIIGNGNYLEPLTFARYQMGLAEQVQFLGGRFPIGRAG